MGRIAIPGVVDALIVKDADLIGALAHDPRLDRVYAPRGPIINRLLLGRLRRVLQLGGVPLPPVAAHGPARPTPDQQALEQRLDSLAAQGFAAEDLRPLADYVRGVGAEGEAGRLAQEVVGRLFAPAYTADASSWADAKVLGAAPSNLNPFKALIWALTDRVAKARARLAAKVAGDPSGLHGTGVAIHNLEDAFRQMRRIYADTRGHPVFSDDAVVGQALSAPRQVLRQPTCMMDIEAGRLEPETIVILQLAAANAARPSHGMVFMQDTWSRCPAHHWIPAMMSAVWRQASAEGRR